MPDFRGESLNGRPTPNGAASADRGESRSDPGADDLVRLWGRVRADLLELGRDATKIVRLRWARADLAMREGAHGLLFTLVAALTAVVILLAGAIAFVAGLTGALTALLGGATWAGRLTAGLLILIAGAFVLRALRARMRVQFSAAMKRRFGAPDEITS